MIQSPAFPQNIPTNAYFSTNVDGSGLAPITDKMSLVTPAAYLALGSSNFNSTTTLAPIKTELDLSSLLLRNPYEYNGPIDVDRFALGYAECFGNFFPPTLINKSPTLSLYHGLSFQAIDPETLTQYDLEFTAALGTALFPNMAPRNANNVTTRWPDMAISTSFSVRIKLKAIGVLNIIPPNLVWNDVSPSPFALEFIESGVTAGSNEFNGYVNLTLPLPFILQTA